VNSGIQVFPVYVVTMCGDSVVQGSDVERMCLIVTCQSDYEHRLNGQLQICNSLAILLTVQEAQLCWLGFSSFRG
jgi:hypothetical protein